jgi:hypothetical protein
LPIWISNTRYDLFALQRGPLRNSNASGARIELPRNQRPLIVLAHLQSVNHRPACSASTNPTAETAELTSTKRSSHERLRHPSTYISMRQRPAPGNSTTRLCSALDLRYRQADPGPRRVAPPQAYPPFNRRERTWTLIAYEAFPSRVATHSLTLHAFLRAVRLETPK